MKTNTQVKKAFKAVLKRRKGLFKALAKEEQKDYPSTIKSLLKQRSELLKRIEVLELDVAALRVEAEALRQARIRQDHIMAVYRERKPEEHYGPNYGERIQDAEHPDRWYEIYPTFVAK